MGPVVTEWHHRNRFAYTREHKNWHIAIAPLCSSKMMLQKTFLRLSVKGINGECANLVALWYTQIATHDSALYA